jgi:hypothetical protein
MTHKQVERFIRYGGDFVTVPFVVVVGGAIIIIIIEARGKALPSPTSGGRSVGIIRLRTTGQGVFF